MRYEFDMRAEGERPVNSSLAYPLYSELMRNVSEEFADTLHEQGFTPLSQYLHIPDRNQPDRLLWRVSVFDEQAIEEFSPVLNSFSEITLDNHSLRLKKEDVVCDELISPERLIREGAESESTGSQTIKLLSPTTFKSAGQYVLFPSAELILKSLFTQWNCCFEEFLLRDEDMMNMLLSGVRISGYRLSSTSFRMKGQGIPSFIGSVTLSPHLSPPIMQIYKTLLRFGEYSGIGIKTALGMGGFRINE